MKAFRSSGKDAQCITLLAGVSALTDCSLSPAALAVGSSCSLQLSLVSCLPSAGAPGGRGFTQLPCRMCCPLGSSDRTRSACATSLRDSWRTNKGRLLQGELLNASHLGASGTWICLEQSFKDWTQFSCLPPPINRVAESTLLLDCISFPLKQQFSQAPCDVL